MINVLLYLSLLLSSSLYAGEGFVSLQDNQLISHIESIEYEKSSDKESTDSDGEDKQPFVQYASQELCKGYQTHACITSHLLFSNSCNTLQLIRAPPHFS